MKTTAQVEEGMAKLESAIDYLSKQVTQEYDPLDEALAVLDSAHYALTVELDSTF